MSAVRTAIERARPFARILWQYCASRVRSPRHAGKLLTPGSIPIGMSAAILAPGRSLGFDRAQLRDALLAGSADSFALRAVPGPAASETPVRSGHCWQDLDHRASWRRIRTAMAALVSAAQSMLDRLERAAPEQE